MGFVHWAGLPLIVSSKTTIRINPKTGKNVTIPGLLEFAREYLEVDYIFWCTQEPYYSEKLIPFLKSAE